MNRRTARTRAIQSLFQIEVGKTDLEEAIANVLAENEERDPFMDELVVGTVEHMKDIDPVIGNSLKHWNIKRIGNVDRCILRMAVFELMYLDDVPRKVSLNEAIDLAKLFGGEESGKFVNGVLSKIAEEKGE